MAQSDTILQYISGLVRGNTVDTLGLPVDLINTALKPVGLASEKPIGGSKQLRELFGQPEEAGSVAELVGSLVSLGGGAKAMMLPALLREHGTARAFEKFNKQFYMSGEGAQAFGEGIYTTERLGKHYAEVAYSANKLRAEKDASEISALEWQLRDRYAPGKLPMNAADAKVISDRIKKLTADKEAALADIGKYKLTVKLPAGEWMNWDAPNPDIVKKNKQLQELGATAEQTGKELYQLVQRKLPDVSPAEYLNSLGIKGHIFMDAMSRKAGKGTTNQVTYNPEELEIIAKEKL